MPNPQPKLNKEIKEDLKRKNWTADQWKNSNDEIDRFLYWVNWLSLHNLWKAREVYREKIREIIRQEILDVLERVRLEKRSLANSLLKENNLQLHKENQNLKSQKGLINPTYEELWDFVITDKTNNLEWSKDFDCTEFSNRFIKNFAEKGFFSCTTEQKCLL